MTTDRDFRAELDALDDGEAASDAPSSMPSDDRPATETRAASSGIFDRAILQKQFDDRDALEQARRQSSPAWAKDGMLGNWGRLDEAGQRQAVQDEKSAADNDVGFWDSIVRNVVPGFNSARDYVYGKAGDAIERLAKPSTEAGPLNKALDLINLGPQIVSGGITDWAADKSLRNLAEAKHRKALAEQMEQGKLAPAQFNQWRARVDDVSRGLGDAVGSMVKGAAYTGYGLFGQNQSDAQKSAVYSIGAYIEEEAKKLAPADPARAKEFTTALGEGAGSMVAFFGPAIAARILGATGNLGAVAMSSGSGATAQAGEMVDEALAKYSATAKAEGRTTLTPEEERQATQVWLMSLGIGATEGAPFAAFLGGHSGRMTRRILAQMVEEGGQEFVQSILENAVAKHYYDPDRRWDDNAWTGLAVGGILGAKMQGASEAITALRRKKDQPEDGVAKVEPTLGAPAPDARDVAPSLDSEDRPGGKGPSVRTTKSASPDLDQFRSIIQQAAPAPVAQAEQPAEQVVVETVSKVVESVSGKLAEGKAPSWNDLYQALPKDEAGDPDVGAFFSAAEKFGARAWNSLDESQKREVYRQFAPVIEQAAPVIQQIAEAIAGPQDAAGGVSVSWPTNAGVQTVSGLTKSEADKKAAELKAMGYSPTVGESEASRRGARSAQQAALIERGFQNPKGGQEAAFAQGLAEGRARKATDLRPAFNRLLNSKTKRADWAKALNASPEQLDALVKEALADGRLKTTKSGGVARTGKKVAIKPTAPAPEITAQPPVDTLRAGPPLNSIDVTVPFDVVEDGSQVTMVMPASEAIAMADRRLKGLELMKRCLGA
jgi:hypothetical protein